MMSEADMHSAFAFGEKVAWCKVYGQLIVIGRLVIEKTGRY